MAHARNVRLIGESTRKDDRLDAKTLARLARIDPALLSPVRHRSAEAQAHLTRIRARAVLVGELRIPLDKPTHILSARILVNAISNFHLGPRM